jgi:mono/diheme cytochrome c family protein
MVSVLKASCILTTSLLIQCLFISCSNGTKNESSLEQFDSSYSKSVKAEVLIDSIKYRNGESIFRADCQACHGGRDKTDNYLEGVVERVGPDYLKLYLTRQDSLITAKNEYALKLKDVFGNLGNSHNFKYSDEQLNAIIEYLK